MELCITITGLIHTVYGEEIPLTTLGPMSITRASHVEPDPQGQWWADLAPVSGPRLGPFDRRSTALRAESEWLCGHRLRMADPTPTVSAGHITSMPVSGRKDS